MRKLAVVALLLLCGCNTYKKQLNKTRNFLDDHPDVLAALCAKSFPVMDKYIKGDSIIVVDTVTVKGDSIPCPPAEQGKTVYVKCPDQKVITKYVKVTDTVVKKDVAELTTLVNQNKVLSDSLVTVKQQLKSTQETSKTRLWWVIGLAIVAIGGVLGTLKGFFKL